MRISYLTTEPINIYNWSGLDFYIAKSLENAGAELDYVGNVNVKRDIRFYGNKAFYKLFKKKYLWDRTTLTAQAFAKEAERFIKPNTDIIFSPGSLPISLVESKKPKVFYHDSTFALMVNFYHQFTNLTASSIREGNLLEQAALDSCSLAIYCSEWAAQSAINDYHTKPEKVKVVPFGANIEIDHNLADIKAAIKNRPTNKCKLLFLGVDWERKGGDLAVQVAEKLNAVGLPAELHIAGISNFPADRFPSYVINHGFISKKDEAGKAKIEKLISDSHFLILPTKAECYGLVFCEANAFGVPCIASDVGGIPTIIKDHINGKTFSLTESIEAYIKFIQSYFNDYQKYEQLALSSFNEYITRLNWDVAGKQVMELLKTCA